MTEILLSILAKHLTFVTANGAFDNNFRTRSRRSIHIGWGHTVKLRAQSTSCKTNRRYAAILSFLAQNLFS
jgi:hypothetical protein